MKRILLSTICLTFAVGAIAQTADKKVQAGLAFQTGLNMNKPGTKIIEADGVGATNALGLNLNFRMTPNIAFATGVEFDFDSFKYNMVSTKSLYYRYSDTKIYQNEDAATDANSTMYRVTHRKQKVNYLSIPTMLLFRTNPIGDFRYYGKFGVRSGFVLGYTMNDDGYNVTIDTATMVLKETAASNDGMKTKDDMIFFRSSVGIVGGAEWNFTGSTSLFAEIGFYYGFTNVHTGNAITGDDKTRNMTLFNRNVDPSDATKITNDYLPLNAKQKQIVLKVGILF